MSHQSTDIVRTTLGVLLIVAMIGACIWVLKPFLLAAMWAIMTVIATWPPMLFLERKLWRRRGLAAAVMTGLFLLLFVLPVSFAIGTVVDNADDIVNWIKSLGNFATPDAPEWLKALPYVGPRLTVRWREIAATTPEEIKAHLLPHVGTLLKWFVGQVGNLGSMLLNLLLTLAIAAVLYVKGEEAAAGILSFARRIAGIRGEQSVRLAAQAIRAVATGVVVTALVQTAFTWVGLAVAGIPFAVLLTAVCFLLSIAQIGPVPVLLSAVFWLYWKGEPGWAAGLFFWTIPVGALDNFLRPLLIRKTGNLSLLLILPGVIGGLIGFGFIGIFIGPMVLAVAYTILAAWVREGDAEDPVDALRPTGLDK